MSDMHVIDGDGSDRPDGLSMRLSTKVTGEFVYVCVNGCDLNGDGSIDRPFATVEKAFESLGGGKDD